ncbi:MAG TPA: winged helix-turn-helix domain-containing protein [Steroidobacteraceae bacterium]|jgi:TolB-like protein/DNA-binding winged helix-turn-helix (wHTH) protein
MSARFRIGDLTLDTGRRLLLCDSKPVALGPLTYQLLLTLVQAAPNVVTHDELARSIWGGRPVSPETISQRVKLLRDALSDDPHNPRYVELVRGQGYKLLPQVEVLPQEPAAGGRSRWLAWVGAAAILLLVAVAVVFSIVRAPTSAVRQGSSIAVLPFVDLSPAGDQQYLADGMAEEILNLLAKTTSLRVIARTSSFSFRGKETDVRRIAEVLGVTNVLEGSVRREGDRIRVTVRLVAAADGSRLWSEAYDQQVGNILALQSDVAASVAAALKANLEKDAAEVVRPVNEAAYDLYLRGQQEFLLGSSGDAAARYFEQAIAIDPEFIPAYYGLGAIYAGDVVDLRVAVAENREKLRDLLRRGLRHAPEDPGLLGLSAQLARYDGDIQLADERFATSVRRDPANLTIRWLYAMFKLDRSEPEEAIRLLRRSLEIDPLNPRTYATLWASHMDHWNAKEATLAAAHFGEVTGYPYFAEYVTSAVKLLLLGDLAGSITGIEKSAAHLPRAGENSLYWLPMMYYSLGAVETADALLTAVRPIPFDGSPIIDATEAYRHVVYGDIQEARHLALSALTAPKKIWGGQEGDVIILRLALDAMIDSGEPQRAIDFLETLAPEFVRYRTTRDIDPRDFAPAPTRVKSAYSSYPALYFTDYARALRAVGDEVGANNMLDHVEAVLELRRKRGLLIEERYAAEVLALRGRTEAALDALEKAERDRTIYYRWHLTVLHNEIFAGLRNNPRFVAFIERIQREMSRQREQLDSAKN